MTIVSPLGAAVCATARGASSSILQARARAKNGRISSHPVVNHMTTLMQHTIHTHGLKWRHVTISEEMYVRFLRIPS
jgi:hypothetical protein